MQAEIGRKRRTARSLVVQPHSDDLVFNGWKLLNEGVIPLPAVVVTVFSRSSHLARAFRAESIDEVSAIRGREDELVWSCFQGVSRIAGLGFRDLPDRASGSDSELLAFQIECEIIRLVKELGVSFLVVQHPSRQAYHLDHDITLRAAVRAAAEVRDAELLLLNDAPYSVANLRAEELLDLGFRPTLLSLSPAEVGRKQQAMLLYASQMRPRFFEFVSRQAWEAIWAPCRFLDRPSKLSAKDHLLAGLARAGCSEASGTGVRRKPPLSV